MPLTEAWTVVLAGVLVAEGGFEPTDLVVMSHASYRCSTPQDTVCRLKWCLVNLYSVVELRRIERPFPACKTSVLPLNYSPAVPPEGIEPSLRPYERQADTVSRWLEVKIDFCQKPMMWPFGHRQIRSPPLIDRVVGTQRHGQGLVSLTLIIAQETVGTSRSQQPLRERRSRTRDHLLVQCAQ